MDEFDKYLSQPHPENDESQITITNEQVRLILGAVQSMFHTAMGTSNQLVITLTVQQPGEKPTWCAVINGTTLMVDDLEEFISAINRIVG